MNMITYDQVKEAMINPPTADLVYLFNDIGAYLNNHPLCVLDEHPFEILDQSGNFCISATSIQSEYIAFVLGKHIKSSFPVEVIEQFFNVDNDFNLQFSKIKGRRIDGCICIIHQLNKEYDLQEVYENIYK